MPMRPKHQCRYYGCHNMTYSTYCPEHESLVKQKWNRNTDRRRGSAAERGYDSTWREYRISYLTEHPLCVECEKAGEFVPATEVDHIKPVHGQSDPLFWDPNNHQGLCHRHHSGKTAKENGAFGNKKT